MNKRETFNLIDTLSLAKFYLNQDLINQEVGIYIIPSSHWLLCVVCSCGVLLM